MSDCVIEITEPFILKNKIKELKKTYNIYWQLDPRKPRKYSYEGLNFSFLYEPFYVGKSFRIDKRKKEHILEASSNKKFFNTIKSGKSWKGYKIERIVTNELVVRKTS